MGVKPVNGPISSIPHVGQAIIKAIIAVREDEVNGDGLPFVDYCAISIHSIVGINL